MLDCTGLDWTVHMEQKLWAVAFVLVLLKIRLEFLHGEMDADWAFGSQEADPLNFTHQ